MPFRLEFDATHRILLISCDGVFSDDDLADGYSALRDCSKSHGPFSCIVDYTGVTKFTVSSQAVINLAHMEPTIPVDYLQINVTPKTAYFGMARMFQILTSESRPNLRVVSTMKEAYLMLGVASPSYSPVEYKLRKRK